GNLAQRAYGKMTVTEQFACNYGLNPAYRERLNAGRLHVAGLDPAGEVRIVELGAHRFFLATLFLPQVSSGPGRPHPLITAYLQAAHQWRKRIFAVSASALANTSTALKPPP